jgi:2-polyprenyl-6-methoxyphenol hydroxylase-like FAD-dependent oxidoreductase
LSSSENSTDIVIVGGGVAGLAAAIGLAPYGMNIRILERRAQVGGIHRGDSLLPKSMAILSQWGLRSAIEAAGAKPIYWMEVHAPGGKHVYRSPITKEDTPHPYMVLPHARLEAVLMAHASSLPNVTIVRPATFTGLIFDEITGRAKGVSYRNVTGAEEIYASAIIAADGQHSLLRKSLNIDFDAYRYDHAYLGLEAARPVGYHDAMRIHFHAEGGVLLMPHPDCVGVGMMVNSGTAKQWLTMDEATLSAELSKRAPVLQDMKLNLQGAHLYELTRAHAARYAENGVAIIGDAAHCTNPTAGQGMAMALVDAGVLAEVLGTQWRRDPSALDAALAAYEAQQHPVNQRLVTHSHWLAQAYGLRGAAWTRAKLAGVMALSTPFMQSVTGKLVSRFLH